MTESVGIIGLGLLGSAVAERLVSADYKVTGFDIDSARRQVLAGIGGVVTDHPRGVLEQSRTILLVLPNSKIAIDVIAGLAPIPSGTTLLDLTTGDPDEMQATGERLASVNVGYIDATVGGSSEQTRRRESIVMAGGTVDAVDACRPLLATFAREVFHVGPCGSGARMKLAMNLVLGLNRAALAEGLAFAKAQGLSMQAALDVFRAGPAWSRAMDVKGRRMLEGDFHAEARLSQHRKDVDLILAAAARSGAHTPLSALHRELLTELEREGFGLEDNSAIIRAFLRG